MIDTRSAAALRETTRLTQREIEVLALILAGKSSQEVAEVLLCSRKTVDYHLWNIYTKLQVSNRIRAAHQASPALTDCVTSATSRN